MTRVEPLEPRRHLAATLMPDPTFSEDGMLQLPTSRADSLLAVDGAVFAQNGQTFYKFFDNGQLDTSCGTNGQVEIDIESPQMAYDKRLNALYVAGRGDGTASRPLVCVARLTSTGQLDASYGAGGYAGYTPVSTDPDVSVGTTLTKILPISGKGLMIGFDRTTTRPLGTDALYAPTGGEAEAVLMKLRSNGSRDPGFARRGTLTLLGGSTSFSGSEFSFDYRYTLPHIVDLAEFTTGVNVVLTREEGSVSGANSAVVQDEDATFQIKYRTVSNTGVVDPSVAHSWTLVKGVKTNGIDAEQPSGNTFAPLTIRLDQPLQISVVGQVKRFDFDSSTSRYSVSTSQPYAFRLTPGVRPSPKLLTTLPNVTQVFQTKRDRFYAINVNGVVQRIASDLGSTRPSVVFGTATFDPAYTFDTDSSGRLLASKGDLLERLR
jgi:hypothetical protein